MAEYSETWGLPWENRDTIGNETSYDGTQTLWDMEFPVTEHARCGTQSLLEWNINTALSLMLQNTTGHSNSYSATMGPGSSHGGSKRGVEHPAVEQRHCWTCSSSWGAATCWELPCASVNLRRQQDSSPTVRIQGAFCCKQWIQ